MLIAFNIFSAFIIDAFISEYEAINGDGPRASGDDPDRDDVLPPLETHAALGSRG